jgi:peptidoglycan/xylan/chitin deacetylase (PgdA/CDA1 family)
MSATFSCSIDDGHPSDLKLAALLARLDLPATFYFPIKNCEGKPVMVPAQMREIAQRFEVGSHTHDHCFLAQVNDAQAERQIGLGKSVLEDRLGRAIPGFCYPGGKYRRAHVDMVKQAGFRYARTTMNLCLDAGGNRYEMATTCQFYPHERAVYVRNFARAGRWSKRGAGLARALQRHDWLERLYALFDHADARDAVFHLWAHSSDIDEQGGWPALAQLLSYVAERVPPQARLNNAQLAERFFPGDGSRS